MKTHPQIDALITCETSKRPYRELFLARYYQQQWTAKKLFTIGIICRDSGLSPDKQWYYCASVNNGTFLGRVGQPKLKKISEELLNCRFSPDGRYLLGTEHFSSGIIVFDLSRNARAIVIESLPLMQPPTSRAGLLAGTLMAAPSGIVRGGIARSTFVC